MRQLTWPQGQHVANTHLLEQNLHDSDPKNHKSQGIVPTILTCLNLCLLQGHLWIGKLALYIFWCLEAFPRGFVLPVQAKPRFLHLDQSLHMILKSSARCHHLLDTAVTNCTQKNVLFLTRLSTRMMVSFLTSIWECLQRLWQNSAAGLSGTFITKFPNKVAWVHWMPSSIFWFPQRLPFIKSDKASPYTETF